MRKYKETIQLQRLQHQEESDEYRFQIAKLQEQVKTIEFKCNRELAMANDKLKTSESHVQILQTENQRLAESVRVRKEHQNNMRNANSQKQILAKDNLIKELTNKLKESTRVIHEVRQGSNFSHGSYSEDEMWQQVRLLEEQVKRMETKHAKQIVEVKTQSDSYLTEAKAQIEQERNQVQKRRAQIEKES